MRARRGGVLSASVLVALGTSLLLVLVIGLGLSELAGQGGGGMPSLAQRQAASVVVPAVSSTHRERPVTGQSPPAVSADGDVAPLAPSASGQATAKVPGTRPTSSGSTAGASTQPTPSRPHATATPTVAPTASSPSPSRTHGNGHRHGNGSSKGHGHPTPKKS